jgi:AraC-like DNA-binding protein
VNELAAVAAALPGQRYEAAPATPGTCWWSLRRGDAVAYETAVPPGLHVGAGIAALRSRWAGGSLELTSAGVTLLFVEAALPVRSQLGAGDARATGLHVPLGALETDPDVEPLVRFARSRGPGTARPCRDHGTLARLCAPLRDDLPAPSRRLLVDARALELLALLHEAVGTAESALVRLRPGHRRLADRARERVHGSFPEIPTVSELARSLGTNRRTLTEAFRARHGSTLVAYVHELRLQRARRLLRGGAGVTESALAVGLSPNHLSTAYRRRFGERPSRTGRIGAAEDTPPSPAAEPDQRRR